ncbi:MAG: PQQ-binding-like beta-propeller repeat protein [Candidatus Promineifilaceae bacterium]|nr:PQQ-binding-like beta-propeller repeat protein [Candidatus Promineifilaceae bacterium]
MRARVLWATSICVFAGVLVSACSTLRHVNWVGRLSRSALSTEGGDRTLSSQGAKLNELWQAEGVLVNPNDGDSPLAYIQDRAVIQGVILPFPLQRVSGFDAESGVLAWSSDTLLAEHVDASEDIVVVATRDGRIIGRDPRDGSRLWSRRISLVGGATALDVKHGRVYATTYPRNFHELDVQSGEILRQGQTESLGEVLFIDEGIRYGREGFTRILYAYSERANELLWRTNVGRAVYESPEFLDERIVVRTGERSGQLVVLDRMSGAIQFRSENTLVSNIAMLDREALFVRSSGEIVGFNIDSGSTRVVGSLNSHWIAEDAISHGIYLSIDEANERIFIVLGNEERLYAFRISAQPQSP